MPCMEGFGHTRLTTELTTISLSVKRLPDHKMRIYSINTLLKGVSIYKVLVYLSSPANQSVQLLVKHKLEIEGV